MDVALDGAEFGEQSGARRARPLEGCAFAVIGSLGAEAKILQDLGARTYVLPSFMEGLDSLDLDAILTPSPIDVARAVVITNVEGHLEDVRLAIAERLDAAHELSSTLASGEAVCDLSTLGPRQLLRVLGESKSSCIVSVEHGPVSLTVELVDGALAVANGWVGEAQPKRIVGLPVLKVLLALDGGKVSITPRLKRIGQGIVTLAEALETAAHELLGPLVAIGTVGDADATLAVDAGEVKKLVDKLESESRATLPPPPSGSRATSELSSNEVMALVHDLKQEQRTESSTLRPPKKPARTDADERVTVPPPPDVDPTQHERNTLRPPGEPAAEEDRGRIATPSGSWAGAPPDAVAPVEAEVEIELEPIEPPAESSGAFAILDAAAEVAPPARKSLPEAVGMPVAPPTQSSRAWVWIAVAVVALGAAGAAAFFVL